MLSTAVAEDASITAFLSCWAYEEFFHSQALKRLLESAAGLATAEGTESAEHLLNRALASLEHLGEVAEAMTRRLDELLKQAKRLSTE
jgi:hypothetical protein